MPSLLSMPSLAMGLLCASLSACAAAAPPISPDTWTLPVTTTTLPNGLTLVVSEDHSSPTLGICVV
jgi:hypothetical protein